MVRVARHSDRTLLVSVEVHRYPLLGKEITICCEKGSIHEMFESRSSCQTDLGKRREEIFQEKKRLVTQRELPWPRGSEVRA